MNYIGWNIVLIGVQISKPYTGFIRGLLNVVAVEDIQPELHKAGHTVTDVINVP